MLVSAVWIAPAVFAAIDDVAQRRLNGDPPATARELLWSGGDWLIYAFLTPAIFWLSNRWPIARPHLARRAAAHLGVALLFCVAWAVCGKLLQLTLGLLLSPDQVHAFIKAAGDQFWPRLGRDVLSWIFTTLPFGIVVYLTVAGMAHAVRYFVEAREREVQMARLSEQLAGARFAALQAQLNPHFLFNTLNTIAVRARDGDGPGTARIVEQLSDVLRRTLSRHRASEVPLGDELDLVRQYLAIEQARFPDRLRVSFDVEESILSAAVPSFALQHLVENAIRHGIAKRTAAGQVRVTARRLLASDETDTLELSVEDDGPGIDPTVPLPQGHGIENTQERLRALYGDHASLTVTGEPAGGTTAILRIPYREIALESDVAER
ncbi:MAG: hypothetical protein A3H96_06380 [Acidobacteria bacterium RIFCSPLOWO2_02_FULL_67_36]|nr:MAG: hypothetical protein A3H96_06380 [Acidobacteria bacterium RIFCSPLOWO2_02_FULL_67_36]OFW25910.1 MAG: hypothetical protein A3G21_15220 [Acidobacteria bacterium RIFCSPLOWO2_12_FULL_66_21]